MSIPVWYSVSELAGAIKHDSIWVGDTCFEVTNETPLISDDRTHNHRNERFFYLGKTVQNLTLDRVRSIVASYPQRDEPYNVVTNNCWCFARWLMERLGWSGWRLPNPTDLFRNIGYAFDGLKPKNERYYKGRFLEERVMDDEQPKEHGCE